MKKIIVAFIITTMLFAGCSLFKKNPKEAVDDGVAGFGDVKKMSSSLLLNGVTQAPPGEKPARTLFNIEAAVKSDMTDDAQPKVDANIKLTASLDDQNISGALQFRTVDKKIFANISELNFPGAGGDEIKKQMADFLNKWWSLPMGEESTVAKLTDEQKKLQESFKTTKFFKSAADEGSEDVHGIKCTRYRVELDKEAVKKFLVDVARAADNQLSAEEEVAIQKGLDEMEFSGVLWVGGDDLAHRIKGTVTSQPAQGASSSFDIDYSAWDYGKDVALSAPEGAKELNPLMLLPFMGLLGQSAEADIK